MAIKTKTQLKAALNNLVRSGGQGGKTKAADVRNVFIDVIDSGVSTINNTPPDASGNINLQIPAQEVIVEKQLPFDTNVLVPHQQGFVGKHELISDTLPNEISSVAYFTQVDSETTWTPRTDLAAINAWVNSSVTEIIHWRLKTVPTANPASGTGLCEIIRRTKKL